MLKFIKKKCYIKYSEFILKLAMLNLMIYSLKYKEIIAKIAKVNLKTH